ncbi:SRPBCC domain-containing protein [Sphingobacterium corticis]|uniref:SRPBCC domain-containing protein n=1 Tax=Sphingobacterium corticis TaxID=1812823 RepID=A0ABW5NJZ1_9SPHI
MVKNNIEVTKEFTVDVASVYSAWTDQQKLKSWWKPLEKTLKHVDIKQGEKEVVYHFSDDNVDEKDLIIKSEYHEQVENERLEYSWNWYFDDLPIKDGFYTLKVTFEELENGSSITVVQENESEEEGVHPHSEGWEDALNQLKSYVESTHD